MAQQIDPQDTPFDGDLVPETSFRLVDETITAWLKTLTFRKQHPRVNVAWISRQFAQQHELLNKDETKQGATMPWVTLSLMGITPALDRRVVTNIVALGRNPQLWDPKGGGDGCGSTPDPSQLDPDGDNRMLVDLASATSIRASVTSANSGPFDFNAIDSGAAVVLTVIINGVLQTLTFEPGSFGDFAAATAAEVVVAGNAQIEGAAFSAEGDTVRLTVDREGPAGSVEITGGTANDATDGLAFSTSEVVGYAPDEVYVLPFPLPFDIQYQIDFFTKTRQDLRMLTSSFLVRFPYTNETFLKLCVPGLGNQLLPIQLDRMDETSDLETGEAERQLRHTATITARAWIYRVPVRKKTIQNLGVLMFDASGGLLNDPAFTGFYCDPEHYVFNGTQVQSVDESTSPFTPPDRTIAIFNFEDGVLV